MNPDDTKFNIRSLPTLISITEKKKKKKDLLKKSDINDILKR